VRSAARLANRLEDLAFVPPLDRWWRRGLRGRVACLVYHRVGEPEEFPFLTRGGSPVVRADQLERELSFLADEGARFGTFADLRSGWFPAPREIGVIVSFDDGFRSSYGAGLEVLESVGVPGVFFQSTALIDARTLIWEHALYWRTRDDASTERFREIVGRELAALTKVGAGGAALAARLRSRVPGPELERLLAIAREAAGDGDEEAAQAERAYPRAADLLKARALGHEIGSHGDRHYHRATIDVKTFEDDLARSSRALTDLLGTPPSAFSYPFDAHRPGDDAIVGRHFLQAATVGGRAIERDADPLWLPRFAWPGHPRNALRHRRWLSTGRI
jgi:peptidoglycan/xylan/chitin deacetylase (PgdA/CDA1 family)